MSQVFIYFSILMPAGSCIVISMLLGTLSYNTPLTLTAMCLERYVAICMPLRHGQICTVKRTLNVILIIWLIGSIPSFRDFIIVVATEVKTFYFERNLCNYDLMMRSSWQSYMRSVMAMLYFGVMLGTVAFTYVKIMEVARTVSADSSASKARNTILLHTFQLMFCLAVLVSPFVEMEIFRINQNIISHIRKWSVTLSYQLAVFSRDITSFLSMAKRARFLKRPWPIVLQVYDLTRFKQEKLLSTPADVAPIVATNNKSLYS
ncbi:odorant receptor 131-2-like [Polypterus senegalus]|uniref:odorant receptor 131-2-like n=1 Tax=Polypterus senegalus TaxID=55291 RepID=UPI0019645228|nr:odorant receptor 131-2-like [Polypterus senegalus]